MRLKNCDLKSFFQKKKDTGIACFGIGLDFQKMLHNFSEFDWKQGIELLIDNDKAKQGRMAEIQGRAFPIHSLSDALGLLKQKPRAIMITCKSYYEIVEQLEQVKELEDTECYLYHFMMNLPTGESVNWRTDGEFQIPARIHYCWFGRKKLPELYQSCIESWHRHCPDYEIVEWNEDNCNLTENHYVKEAYEQGAYAFVSDYFRLKVILEQGGIYLDTDVELLKSLDCLRHDEAFCGLELPGEVNFGLGFGAKKGNKILEELLRQYQKLHFLTEDGVRNEIICPVYQTECLVRHGMKPGNKFQKIESMTIYPTEVLSPVNLFTNQISLTDNTVCLHHFDGSWVSGERLKKKLRRLEEAKKLQAMFVPGKDTERGGNGNGVNHYSCFKCSEQH